MGTESQKDEIELSAADVREIKSIIERSKRRGEYAALASPEAEGASERLGLSVSALLSLTDDELGQLVAASDDLPSPERDVIEREVARALERRSVRKTSPKR